MSDETPSRAEKLRAKKRAARRKRDSSVPLVGEASSSSAAATSSPDSCVSATTTEATNVVVVGVDSKDGVAPDSADIDAAAESPTDGADGRASDREDATEDEDKDRDEHEQDEERKELRDSRREAYVYNRFRVERLPARVVARVLATLDLVSHLAAARSCVALDAVSRTQDAAPRAATIRISNAAADPATLRWLPPRLTFVAQTHAASRYALASVLRLVKRHQLCVRSRLESELRQGSSATAAPTVVAVVPSSSSPPLLLSPLPSSPLSPPLDCLILRDFRVDAATSIRDWPLAREIVVNASAPHTLALDRVAPSVVRRMWRDLARRRDICKLSLPSLALSAGTFEHSDFSDSRSSVASRSADDIPSAISSAPATTAAACDQRDASVRSTVVEAKQWTELESQSATTPTTPRPPTSENARRGGKKMLSIATLVMGDIACEPYECAVLRGVINLSVRRALRLDALRAAFDVCHLERLMLRRATMAALDCVGASQCLRRSLHTLEVDFDDDGNDDGGSGRVGAPRDIERMLRPICALDNLACLRVRRRCGSERSDVADWRALETLHRLEVLDLEGVTVDPSHPSFFDSWSPPPLLLLPHLALLFEFRAPHGFLFSDLYVKRPAVVAVAAAAAAVVTGSTAIGLVRSESKRASGTEAASTRVPDQKVEASETGTERSATSGVGPLEAASGTPDAVVVATTEAAPAAAAPTDEVAAQQVLADQEADSYRLAFPQLRDLYCRAPYRSCPIERPPPPGAKRRGTEKKRPPPSSPPRYAIHINDIPPHAQLRAVHVGDNLVSVDDLDQLVTCVADDYPRLRCIFGAQRVQHISDIPYSDRDSGTYFSLSDD